MDLLKIAIDTVLRLFSILIIPLFIIYVFGWKHASKQSKLQRQETYLPYVQIPENLPVKIFIHPKVYYQLAILFLLAVCIIDTSFYYSYGQEVIKPLMIISAVILFAVIFLIVEYRRDDDNRSHYILTEKSIIYRERCYTYFDNFEIPYNEIESIMHVCSSESYHKYTLTRIKKRYRKYYRYYHYIIIQGCR